MKNKWIEKWIELGMENYWIGRAWVPPVEADYFIECQTMEELEGHIGRRYWSVGVAFCYRDLCFINQVEGGSEWLVIKEDAAFESLSGHLVVESGGFREFIEDVEKATVEECVKLKYSRMSKKNEEKRGLTRKDWRWVINAQSATSLSELLGSLHEVSERVRGDVENRGAGTFPDHPLTRLYLHRMFYLAFEQEPAWDWETAMKEARRRAEGDCAG